jgi:hypothetical protein
MEEWLTIRDHLKFFEAIIAAKDDASRLFDQCKSINTFFGDQFDSYRQIRKFIDDNRDNFAFLSQDQQEAVATLRSINTDEEPWSKMPSYKKLMKNLNGQLQEKKKELVEAITTKYDAVFAELEKYASDMKVSRDKFAKKDVTISLKTNTNNFYALQANADTSEFYGRQMQIINDAVNPIIVTPPSKPDDPNHGISVHEPPVRVRRLIHLNTHYTEPMHTEEDIDRYLQTLKAQLMKFINGDNDIIVS